MGLSLGGGEGSLLLSFYGGRGGKEIFRGTRNKASPPKRGYRNGRPESFPSRDREKAKRASYDREGPAHEQARGEEE